MIVLILIGIAVVLALDLPELIRQRSLRDTVTFFVLLLAGSVLLFLIVMDIDIPSPIRGFWYLIDKVLNISYPPS